VRRVVGKQEYHVALFELCSQSPSFFETFVIAENAEEAMKKAMDLAFEENRVPKDILEKEKAIFVCVSDEEDEFHYTVFPYKGGGYEYKEYEPLYDLRECNEEDEEN